MTVGRKFVDSAGNKGCMLLPGIETGSIRLDFRLGRWILACQVKQSF